MPDPAGEGGGRTKHGPSSAGERRGCRSQGAGLASRVPHACVARGMVLPSINECTCSFPALQTRMLTDALNIKYPCLPNHALRWLRVTEAAPPSKEIRVFY